jgi:tetratricopeptide (TPR) repeat protein
MSFRLAAAALLLSVATQAVHAQAPVATAEKLIASYHEDLSRIDRAREVLEDALRTERRVETMIVLARVCLLQGEIRATTPEGKLAAYARGREIAERAIELAPKNEDAHFWYAANTGRWGQTKGVMRSLFLLPTMREQVDILLGLNPRAARTHSVAGNLAAEVPTLLGGDKKKAEEHFKKALELDPHYTIARVDFARFLVKEGRHAEARRELERVLAEKAPSHLADWTVRDVPRARELLASIKDRR